MSLLAIFGPSSAGGGGGSGDVSAASNFATDNRIIRSNGTTKGVQASAITLDDSGNLSGVGTINGIVLAAVMGYPEVANFAALPSAAAHSNDIYAVMSGTGGFFSARKPAGYYQSDGAVWAYLGDLSDPYFVDNTLVFSDDVDGTKKLTFQLSSITTSTTRAVTWPDADITVTGIAATQTLTNKTISGASNTLSSIANASLTNSTVTVGSTAIALGASATTIVGLSSLTSTTLVGALTGNATTATALATGRTIAITGDLTWNSGSFDGSGNVTAAGTLATVNGNVGSFGSATTSLTLTTNAKGLITAISSQTVTPAIGSITGFGTGIATALAINVGSAGAPVLFNGALGTPSSGTLTNCTFPTLNQNTSGSAATLATARAIYGNNFDGSAALTQIIASTYGGTGNGFTKISGPTTAERTKTMRDASDTVLELGGSYTPTGVWTSLTMVTPVLGTPTSGTLTNCTFPTLNQNTTGSAASLSISGQSGLMTVTGLASTNRIKTVRDAADTILELGGSYTPSGTWTSLTMVTPVLGTPASGTLTNCTGLPQAGTVGLTTADSPQFAAVNVGAATDTTITRVSAGVIAVEGKTALTATGTFDADAASGPVYAADAGANDTYAITLSPAPAGYTTGTHYRFKANTANTGAATLNVNSLGAKTIKKVAGGITTDLADNDIRSGQFVDLVYDGTNLQMQSLLGNAPSGGAATETEISATVAADTDNWAPTGYATATVIRANFTAALAYISSITAPVSGSQRIRIFNVGTVTGLLKDQKSALGTAGNRLALGGPDLPLVPNDSIDLYYDTTTARWRPLQPISKLIPTRRFGFYDVRSNWNTSSIVDPGMGLSGASAGTAAGTTATAGDTTTLVDYLACTTGSSGTGRTSVISSANLLLLGNSNYWVSEWILRLVSTSDGSNTYVARFGFGDSSTGEPVDGVYFRYTHSVNSGNYECVVRANSAETLATPAATAPNFNAFDRLRIQTSPTLVEFFLNGTLIGSTTTVTNLPVGAGRNTGILAALISSAGAARTMDIISAEMIGYRGTPY